MTVSGLERTVWKTDNDILLGLDTDSRYKVKHGEDSKMDGRECDQTGGAEAWVEWNS